MGEIRTKIKLTNNDDLLELKKGRITEEQVRAVEIEGIIDTGATLLNIPEEIADKLGLSREGFIQITSANNAREIRPKGRGVNLEIAGRNDVFSCVIGPPCSPLLVGQIVLETLDLIADCTTKTVKPAHEEGIIYSAYSATE